MKNPPITTPAQIVRAITQHGAITISGQQGLMLARQAIELAMAQAGLRVTFDPASAPDLVDYLTVATLSGLEGAIAGGGLGAFLGLLFRQPVVGAAVGAGIGGLLGAGRGVQRVRIGWRVRAVREVNGQPFITISSLGAA